MRLLGPAERRLATGSRHVWDAFLRRESCWRSCLDIAPAVYPTQQASAGDAYTFGQPVDGTLTVNVTYEHYGWEKDDCPRINHTGPINGCYDMVVNTTLLRCNENYRVHRRISLVAQVNETGTGVTMNMTNFISRSFNPLELNFLDGEHGKNYFKPTMPFYGRSEEIKSRWGYTDRRLSCKNYTSEVSGIIKFTIRPLKTSVVTISIEAVAMNYETVKYSTYGVEINQPKSTLRLQAWYSPSSNFMQLEPSKGPIPCAGKHSVRLRYTGEPETQKRLHFQIMARGKILKDKVVDVAFNPDASFLVEEDLNAMLPSNMAGSPMSTGSFEFELEPDYSYVPRVKVLAFYVRPDGEVIADFEQFEVEKCLENNVTMRFGSEVVQPATSAAIHLYGSPHSYCGVGIVDKSVHLLKQDNQLTKDKQLCFYVDHHY
ncbi:hypothetical protein HPB52_024569 [Rhipicephalus sanguineus]|uniref:Alpha-2-macroglobulin bait region domain-containing protein n=1 Tax=Rhipicephalus sanguineus TaxID=34632 RepID=A0A9D4SLT6_RHISA|nr:hypothetical protein HPB52_024569 [Rhipicephalus sanguineus]